MMERRNVFDDKTNITLLVHTQSYVGNDSILNYLINANKLDGINILFLPVLNDSTGVLFAGEYIHHKEKNCILSALKFEQCSGIVAIHNMPNPEMSDIEYSKVTEQRILNGRCISNLCDYIVAETPSPDFLDCDIPVVSFMECKEILRLRMVCCSDYHISEHFEIDETLYYIYRQKCLFSAFQLFWESCIDNHNLEWADALDNRLNLMVRCLDQCKISSYKRINNNSIMHIKYHLSYLLLLITGVFDNIAWLINNLYQMKLEQETNGHFNIDLKKKKFHNTLKTKSTEAYSIITDNQFQDRLDAIRELRDRIVHRDFFQAYRGMKANNKNEISYFEADKTLYGKLELAGFSNSDVAIKVANCYLLHMIPFINFLETITVEMVESLLKVITKDIYGKEGSIVLWELFEFPFEPYVL